MRYAVALGGLMIRRAARSGTTTITSEKMYRGKYPETNDRKRHCGGVEQLGTNRIGISQVPSQSHRNAAPIRSIPRTTVHTPEST